MATTPSHPAGLEAGAGAMGAMDGLDGMSWRGFGWQEAVLPVMILVGFAVVFGTIAVLRFRWEAE